MGKTRLGGTALEHIETSPCLYLDVDGGITTVRHQKKLEVKQVRSMQAARDTFNDLYDSVDWESDEPSLPYGSIIIDTLSELAKLDMREIMRNTPAVISGKQNEYVPSQREYLISGERIREIVRAYRDLPCHTFFLCHSGDARDNTNATIYFPQFSGRVKHEISGFIDVIGYMTADLEKGDFYNQIQTQKTKRVAAKDRFDVFSGLIEMPTIPDIIDKIRASDNGKVTSNTTKSKETSK